MSDEKRQIVANLSEQSNGLPWQSYSLGDHLRDERDDDPAREWDEWTSPHTRHPELPPVQDWAVIECPHGEADDRQCRRCMDVVFGTSAPVIASTTERRKSA